jgi:hypothetical protein
MGILSADDLIDLGPESLLGIAEGEDAPTLRDRLDLALRYLANWYKATKGSDNQDIWWEKIDQVRAKVEAAYKSFSPADLFLGKDAVALYNNAAASFPGLYRELALSRDTLPSPGLLDVAADIAETVLETPGYVIAKVGDSLARGIGGAAGSLVERLWPYLLVVGILVVIYLFHEPILGAIT